MKKKIITNHQTEQYERLKSTPGMWVIFFVFLSILVSISIFFLNKIVVGLSEDAIPIKVFTVGDDVISLQLPDDWELSSTTDNQQITFKSKDGFESLSVSNSNDKSISSASILYMLELRTLFPDADSSTLSFSENEIDGKKTYLTQIMYNNRYYLCGVKESGNTVIKFVYSASVMSGEISDIDQIISSIHYREGGTA